MGFSELFTDVITKGESIPNDWYPNKSYIQGVNVVALFGVGGNKNGYYTCIKSNSDKIFNPENWTYSETPTFPSLPANNFQKTQSNINQRFKTVNIWNEQIDNEIKEQGYIIKCPALLIEFIPEEPKQNLGGVTQYPDAKMYFHIYSDQLNSPNSSSIGCGDYMDANIDIYDLRDIVKSTFLSFHSYNCSAFMSRYDSLDYKHKQITKYLLGFSTCFTDDKGSIFDPRSSRYVSGVSINASLNPTHIPDDWVADTTYVAFVNVVLEGAPAQIYLCTTSNNDTIFDPSKWVVLPSWEPSATYIVGAYVYNGMFAYQCSVGNSDVIFNPSNWNLICKI